VRKKIGGLLDERVGSGAEARDAEDHSETTEISNDLHQVRGRTHGQFSFRTPKRCAFPMCVYKPDGSNGNRRRDENQGFC
jgi:hypothetical protein